ncbi:PilN domain-containing protein [Ferrimonas sp. SCSIO 43195]|uniref:PilN domain-containing protein n=1 Tax=Ferrimonas sp. SCSIO 43195 TaxID=2822844 RepID=UPI0020758247|nr:PilN domain-containing protein [Ferrimonas sp. SCSIO 43195]USD37285.1 PilN domain-containing protein [Ferrimonas sp. SCSIO 43195]
MKHRVNLFSSDLLPKQIRLNFNRTVAAMAAVLVLMVAAYGWLSYLHQQSEAELVSLQQQQTDQQQQIKQLTEQMTARQPDQHLLQQVEILQRQLDAMESLGLELDRRSVMANPGFSNLMKELAQSSDQQVWLQRFGVSDNGIVLQGLAQSPAAVPQWLAKLGLKHSLRGRSLSQFTLNGGTDGPVTFVVGHGLEEEEGE